MTKAQFDEAQAHLDRAHELHEEIARKLAVHRELLRKHDSLHAHAVAHGERSRELDRECAALRTQCDALRTQCDDLLEQAEAERAAGLQSLRATQGH